MSLAEASEARKARLQALKKRKTGEAADDEG
jgi:coiled-coil domain-containing protein 12